MAYSKRAKELPVSAVRKLTPYMVSAKESGKKVYHLNIGDPDIKTPDVMIEALRNWNINPIGYAPSNGHPDFLNALHEYYSNIGYSFIKTQNILATVGGSEAIQMAFFTIANPNEEIIVIEPYYSAYESIAKITDIKLVPVTSTIENGFHLPSVTEIESKITSQTRAIMFSNPSNPTGAVYTFEEMQMLVDLAKKHNIYLISDEVYREYLFVDRKHVSLFDFVDQIKNQIIVIDSLSKRYSLCGARLGVLISTNEEFIALAFKMAQARLSGGLVDQILGASLTKVSSDHIENMRQEYEKRMNVLYQGLLEIEGVNLSKPEGAFYAMVELPVEDAEAFCIWLLTDYSNNNETVMFAPGAGFYKTDGMGKNQIRIAYVLNETDLKRCIEILKDALNQYQTLNKN